MKSITKASLFLFCMSIYCQYSIASETVVSLADMTKAASQLLNVNIGSNAKTLVFNGIEPEYKNSCWVTIESYDEGVNYQIKQHVPSNDSEFAYFENVDAISFWKDSAANSLRYQVSNASRSDEEMDNGGSWQEIEFKGDSNGETVLVAIQNSWGYQTGTQCLIKIK